LVSIDEEKAWPSVQKLIQEHENWKLRSVLGHLSPSGKVECIKQWLPNPRDSWFFKDILKTLESAEIPVDTRRNLLLLLLEKVDSFPGRFEDRGIIDGAVRGELNQIASAEIQARSGTQTA